MTVPMTGAGAISREPEWTGPASPECDVPCRAVISACPCPAIIVSPAGKILAANAAFRDLSGHTGEGTPHADIGAFLDPNSVMLLRNGTAPGSGTFPGECKCRGGASVQTDITVSPAGHGGTAVFLAPSGGVTFHASEETAVRVPRLEILGLAAAGASHHLNSLLTGILGNISLATLDAGRTVLPHLRQAERSVSVAASFTRKVLDLVRGVRTEPEPFDAGALVEETAEIIRAIVSRRITVETVKRPPLPPMMADRADITFALLTLGLNARDAIEDAGNASSPDRERKITLETSSIPASGDDGPRVTVTVSDTGGGMSEEVSRRVFEPFFTTKNDGRGTGIGLAITHRLIARNRGRCEFTSSPGNGSSFAITIPAAPTGTPVAKPEPSGTPLKGHGTILLMDDDELVRAFAKAILERHGYTVLLAADGQEGLTAFRDAREGIRLVIIDLTMPVLSGREALREIREIDPRIPAIITSGFDQGSIRDQIREFDDVQILLKPFTILALTEMVRKTMND